jgi:gliding motility-associated lipoprotein GldD
MKAPIRGWIALIIFIPFLTICGCSEKYTPKPHGYFRIEFPEKNYQKIPDKFPYQFEIPTYSVITHDRFAPDSTDWINVTVPENKAEVHISYYSLKNQKKSAHEFLTELMEESHELAYKHTIKADAIEEQVFMNPSNNVFGLIYRIEGNAASPFQFFLTDSTTNFLRGALYINEVPNIDSIKPVIDFLEPDIIHMIESTSWK